MALNAEVLGALLERIRESRKELEDAELRQEELIALHDNVRDVAYADWDPSSFKKEDVRTWPPLLQRPETIFDYLDKLNQGVGYSHRLVIEHRYPEQHKPATVVSQPVIPDGGGNTIIQTMPPRQIISEDASRARGFWGGYFENQLKQRELKHLEQMRDLDQTIKKKDITTEVIQRDPIEMGNEILGALNATKQFVADVYLCWEGHMNRYFATQAHQNFRSRMSRLIGVIESFVFAATDLDIKEIRGTMTQQLHLYTRILEAQAQTPTTIQEITRPFREKGFDDKDLELDGSKRMHLGRDEAEEGEETIIDLSQLEDPTVAPENIEPLVPEEELDAEGN